MRKFQQLSYEEVKYLISVLNETILTHGEISYEGEILIKDLESELELRG